MTTRIFPASACVLLAIACGGKKDDAKPAPTNAAPAAATERTKVLNAAPIETLRPSAAPPAADASPTAAPTPAGAPIDPAAFQPVDLSSVAALAKVKASAPAGATVTPDAPPFGEDKPTGAVIAQGGFALHLWHSTVGGERDRARMTAEMTSPPGAYAETKSTEKVVEYTITTSGVTTYGFLRPIDGFTKMGDQLLCGTAAPVARLEDLAPYRAACDTVGKK